MWNRNCQPESVSSNAFVTSWQRVMFGFNIGICFGYLPCPKLEKKDGHMYTGRLCCWESDRMNHSRLQISLGTEEVSFYTNLQEACNKRRDWNVSLWRQCSHTQHILLLADPHVTWPGGFCVTGMHNSIARPAKIDPEWKRTVISTTNVPSTQEGWLSKMTAYVLDNQASIPGRGNGFYFRQQL
jgi:hypothetical protein